MKSRPQPARASTGFSRGASDDEAWSAASTDLSTRIQALFARCPDLCGFSVQAKVCAEGSPAADEELFVTAIGIAPQAGKEQYGAIFEEISTTLKDLLAERPEAHFLLRGRTFARTLH